MEIDVREHTCATKGCGVTFWTTDKYDDRRREQHNDFYCPNGHPMSYPGETDAQKLTKAKADRDTYLRQRDEMGTEKRRLERKIGELRKLLPKPPAKKPAKKAKK